MNEQSSISSDVASPSLFRNHFIGELGIEHWVDENTSYGRAEISPEMLVPGTGFVRIGLLATLADVVSGQPPTGVITPTTDLSVHVGRLVELKCVHLESRVIKAGATLAVVKTRITADDEIEPFATSMATFMNRKIDISLPPSEGGLKLNEPLSSRIGAHILSPGTVELMPNGEIANAHHGTVQGGVVSLLGELAAESAVEQDTPFVVTDLDIRFLNRAKVGPLRAVTEVLSHDPSNRMLGVDIRDQGDQQRLVAYMAASGHSLS